jgi:hypothetical protein
MGYAISRKVESTRQRLYKVDGLREVNATT